MIKMEPGIVKSQDSLEDIRWNILGQTYVPKQLTTSSFSWHATLPPGTFVPPHIHPDQDEFLYILEGKFDFWLDGVEAVGEPGDLIHVAVGRQIIGWAVCPFVAQGQVFRIRQTNAYCADLLESSFASTRIQGSHEP